MSVKPRVDVQDVAIIVNLGGPLTQQQKRVVQRLLAEELGEVEVWDVHPRGETLGAQIASILEAVRGVSTSVWGVILPPDPYLAVRAYAVLKGPRPWLYIIRVGETVEVIR